MRQHAEGRRLIGGCGIKKGHGCLPNQSVGGRAPEPPTARSNFGCAELEQPKTDTRPTVIDLSAPDRMVSGAAPMHVSHGLSECARILPFRKNSLAAATHAVAFAKMVPSRNHIVHMCTICRLTGSETEPVNSHCSAVPIPNRGPRWRASRPADIKSEACFAFVGLIACNVGILARSSVIFYCREVPLSEGHECGHVQAVPYAAAPEVGDFSAGGAAGSIPPHLKRSMRERRTYSEIVVISRSAASLTAATSGGGAQICNVGFRCSWAISDDSR
jgi:hypothetical protein